METHSPEIDVENLTKKIRQEVARRCKANPTSQLLSSQVDASEIANQLRYIEQFISVAESRVQVRNKLPDKFKGFPFVLLKSFESVVLKIFNTLFRDQREVNFNILNVLRRSLYLNQKLFEQMQNLQQSLKENEQRNWQNTNDLKNELTQQKRLITTFLEEADKRLPEPFNQEQLQIFSTALDHSLDGFYVAFEDRFRGSRELIQKRLQVYLKLLKDAQIEPDNSLFLDLACGRGEWLEILKKNGYRAIGVDLNQVLIEQCRTRDLDVIQGDIIAYLKSLPDESVTVVTGFHIIEHLPFEILMKLLSETFRVLRYGGLAIFETPNPENVLVGSYYFYTDPTHRNPLPSSTTEFLAQYSGFSQVKILNLNPNDETLIADDSELSRRFNKYFYGNTDYAVIGYKLFE